MENIRKEDFAILVTVKVKNRTVARNVRCKVFLPLKYEDELLLHLHLKENQYKKLERIFEVSIYGKNYPDFSPFDIITEIAYRYKAEKQPWFHKNNEYVLIMKPKNLVRKIPLTWNSDKRNAIFRLTPNKLLNTQIMETNYSNGEIKIDVAAKVSINLPDEISLNFERNFKHYENSKNETVRFYELIAICELPLNSKLNASSVFTEYVEDVLLLASLANRHRCSCVGWEFLEENLITDFFRGDISVPEEKKDNHDVLIDIGDIEEFLQTAFDNFRDLEFKQNIRRAIMLTLPDRETVESEFLSLFTALETLVLGFRRSKNREFIFSDLNEWQRFNSDFQNWVKKESFLKDEKDKRKLIYEVSGGLQRVSFAGAYKEMCEYFSLDLSDLWSVSIRENKEWSLTDIRNNLVHGESLGQPKIFSLWTANANLRWTVERLILSVLGWEVSKSKVSPRRLSYLTAYHSWRTDRTKISQS